VVLITPIACQYGTPKVVESEPSIPWRHTEPAECVAPKLELEATLPTTWRVAPRSTGYCAIRSGSRPLLGDALGELRSALDARIAPLTLRSKGYAPLEGGVHGTGTSVCWLNDPPECPAPRCLCLTVDEYGCVLSTIDLALLAEEELVRLGYADAQVTTCINANMRVGHLPLPSSRGSST